MFLTLLHSLFILLTHSIVLALLLMLWRSCNFSRSCGRKKLNFTRYTPQRVKFQKYRGKSDILWSNDMWQLEEKLLFTTHITKTMLYKENGVVWFKEKTNQCPLKMIFKVFLMVFKFHVSCLLNCFASAAFVHLESFYQPFFLNSVPL